MTAHLRGGGELSLCGRWWPSWVREEEAGVGAEHCTECVQLHAQQVVPRHEETSALAGAIREGDLTAKQTELLAQLVVQVGCALRVRGMVSGRHLDPLWGPLAVAYRELLGAGR